MTKYKFNKIAKQYGLTFKEAINLVAIKGEIDKNAKYEGVNFMYLNQSMPPRQIKKVYALKEKKFIEINQDSVNLSIKGIRFPLNIGAVSYLDGFDDEDILENVRTN